VSLRAGHNVSAPELILAFDYGTRRIGVASGDTLTRTARGLTVLEVHGTVPWADIVRLVADYTPTQLVVGLPCNMDGTETGMTRPARQFSQDLKARVHLPVHLVDERLSSRDAEAELRAARASGLKRKRVTHADVDRIAAKVILERWFAEQPASRPGASG
jgi:putative holliday junction resolvase